MLRSLFISASGMQAQQLRMDVIANNLANANTTGFKKTRAEFDELFAETLKSPTAARARGGGDPAPLQIGLGVRTGATTRSFGQGDLNTTNNPLDLAIQGAGFFRVQQANGDPAYTRAGNFRVDSTGQLVTQHGEQVDPGIQIPSDAVSVTVNADGTISATVASSTTPVNLGTINLYTFTNPGGLSSIGNNLFAPTAGSGDAQLAHPGQEGAGTIAQGMLEGANVQAVEEMIAMIDCQRSFELNSKVITTADQMLQRITNIR